MTRRNDRRPWSLALSLGLPLAVVGMSAMAISYATLIDVARVNGMPLSELFPILIDVGTVACMVAAAEFRRRGIRGGWLAYLTFSALSALSVFANATHAIGAADLGATTTGVAVMIAATPPAALLAITHLVMRLIPEAAAGRAPFADQVETLSATVTNAATPSTRSPDTCSDVTEKPGPLDGIDVSAPADRRHEGEPTISLENDVDARLREAIASGTLPTGREVGAWMGGKSPRTGQRYIAAFMERDSERASTSS